MSLPCSSPSPRPSLGASGAWGSGMPEQPLVPNQANLPCSLEGHTSDGSRPTRSTAACLRPRGTEVERKHVEISIAP